MTDDKPAIILLPGGDAILASKIEMVCVRPAETVLGNDWPVRVQVNGSEYACDDGDHAIIERDRIIDEWKVALRGPEGVGTTGMTPREVEAGSGKLRITLEIDEAIGDGYLSRDMWVHWGEMAGWETETRAAYYRACKVIEDMEKERASLSEARGD